MMYTLDPLGLMIDASGPVSMIVPVPEIPALPPEPEALSETETVRPEELGSQVDLSV